MTSIPPSSSPNSEEFKSKTKSKTKAETPTTPYRQIRALYDENTITVYQAYSQEIAEAAVREQRLDASPAFKYERMTWIKPSWCWMMYRSNYTTKDPRQTHILALTLTHASFLSLLSQATVCNHHSGPLTPSQREKPVRVQWDPERDPALEVLPYRSLQVGIGREVVRWWVRGESESESSGDGDGDGAQGEGGAVGIVRIEDVSARARELGAWVEEREGRLGKGEGRKVSDEEWEELVETGLMPRERVFDVPEEIRRVLEMD